MTTEETECAICGYTPALCMGDYVPKDTPKGRQIFEELDYWAAEQGYEDFDDLMDDMDWPRSKAL